MRVGLVAYAVLFFLYRFRSTAHGISAAWGKAGAIVGAFGFLYASQDKDPKVSAPYPAGENQLLLIYVVSLTLLAASATIWCLVFKCMVRSILSDPLWFNCWPYRFILSMKRGFQRCAPCAMLLNSYLGRCLSKY